MSPLLTHGKGRKGRSQVPADRPVLRGLQRQRLETDRHLPRDQGVDGAPDAGRSRVPVGGPTPDRRRLLRPDHSPHGLLAPGRPPGRPGQQEDRHRCHEAGGSPAHGQRGTRPLRSPRHDTGSAGDSRAHGPAERPLQPCQVRDPPRDAAPRAAHRRERPPGNLDLSGHHPGNGLRRPAAGSIG